MNNARRTLRPVRLAIPTLLALSAVAAWVPTESSAGTGFSADAVTTSTASLEVKYDRPNFPLDLWSHGEWLNSSAQWSEVVGGELTLHSDVDFLKPVWTGITKPPVHSAHLHIWDDTDYQQRFALAEVSDL